MHKKAILKRLVVKTFDLSHLSAVEQASVANIYSRDIFPQSTRSVCKLSASDCARPTQTCLPGEWRERARSSPSKLDKQWPGGSCWGGDDPLRRPAAAVCLSFSLFSALAALLLLFCLCFDSLSFPLHTLFRRSHLYTWSLKLLTVRPVWWSVKGSGTVWELVSAVTRSNFGGQMLWLCIMLTFNVEAVYKSRVEGENFYECRTRAYGCYLVAVNTRVNSICIEPAETPAESIWSFIYGSCSVSLHFFIRLQRKTLSVLLLLHINLTGYFRN